MEPPRRPLTVHVCCLFAGEPDAGVELPHEELLLSALPDVLDQPAVVDVGAVEADAVPLPNRDRARAERLHHLPGPLTPVVGGHGRDGEGERHEVEGNGEGRPLASLQPHGLAAAAARPAGQDTRGDKKATNPGF